MADEITIDARLRVTNGSFVEDRRVQALKADMTGTGLDHHNQAIGFAAHEAVTVNADVGTEGWAYFTNLDLTNFVQIGVDVAGTFYPLVKLLAGEMAMYRLATGTFHAQADTASVDLEVFVLEA